MRGLVAIGRHGGGDSDDPKPWMSKATCKPLAGYAKATVLVGGTRVTTVGLVSITTCFTGHPMNTGFTLLSKTGSNFLKALAAARRSLKSKGTSPSMHCSGALNTSTILSFRSAGRGCSCISLVG